MKRVGDGFTPAAISGTRFRQHVSSWRSLWGFLKREKERGERREEGGEEEEREGGREKRKESSEGTLPNFIP